MQVNEFGMLKKTMEVEENAVQPVWIVPCPMARAGVPETNCAACRFRCSLIECPDTRRETPEEICDKCFRADPKGRMCRYAKARRGDIAEEKVKRVPGCAFPAKINPQLLAWPVGAVLAEMGDMVLVPKNAPEPPSFLPRMRWNSVRKATEVVVNPADAEEKETPNG